MPSYTSYKRFMAILDEDPDIVGWFTTKTGVHIPLRKGQSKEEATKSFFEKKVVNAPVFKSPESMVDFGSTPEGTEYINKIIGMGGSENEEARRLNDEYQQKRKDFSKGLVEKYVDNPLDADKYYMLERNYDWGGSSDIYKITGVSHEGYHFQPVQSANKQDIQYSRYVGNKNDKYVELTKEQAMNKFADMFPGDTFGGLSKREERALKLYSHFTPQNVALRKGEENPHDTAIIRDIINRTHNSYQGYLFRGVPKTEEFKNLKVGDIYTDKAFMSTSPSVFIAKEFGGLDNYILQIKPAVGFGKAIDISRFSEKPDENEVVLQAGSNFKVVGVDHEKRLIKLEQL